MATVTEEDRKALKALVEAYLTEHGEPAGKLLVDTLTNVGLGYLAASFGNLPPVPRQTEREQMAAHLVPMYLQGTRPSPTNNYVSQLRQVARSYLADVKPSPAVTDEAVTILIALAMGHTRETDPRATRMAATVRFVDLYLKGR